VWGLAGRRVAVNNQNPPFFFWPFRFIFDRRPVAGCRGVGARVVAVGLGADARGSDPMDEVTSPTATQVGRVGVQTCQ